MQGVTQLAFAVRVANLAGLCCRLPGADARTAILQADAPIGMDSRSNTCYCIGCSEATHPEPGWPGGTAPHWESRACMRMLAQPWKPMTAHTLATFPGNTGCFQVEGFGELALGRADCQEQSAFSQLLRLQDRSGCKSARSGWQVPSMQWRPGSCLNSLAVGRPCAHRAGHCRSLCSRLCSLLQDLHKLIVNAKPRPRECDMSRSG